MLQRSMSGATRAFRHCPAAAAKTCSSSRHPLSARSRGGRGVDRKKRESDVVVIDEMLHPTKKRGLRGGEGSRFEKEWFRQGKAKCKTAARYKARE